jgi:cell division protein FtsQ
VAADEDAAPVIPFLPTPERPAVGAPSGDEPRTGGSADGPERLGLRDVWRASRARRRALRAEVRRFTVRQRRRRMLWIGAASAVVLLVLGTVGAAYSPLFAVQRIEVAGTSALDADAVAEALDDQIGTPLPLVNDSAVKAALVRFPLVESYTLEARPPHDLVVRIVERTPVGVIESAAGYTVVDAAGVALATTPMPPSGQPMLSVSGGVRSVAFEAAGRVMRSLPEAIRTQVTAVTATTADDVTLTLGGTGTTVVWGSAEKSAQKALTLETTMRARPPAEVTSYDVSSPSAIVVR